MSGAGSSDSGLDLSGKLIIKAQLGDDIRRIPIHNEDMTYDELILMMQRVFRCSLDPEDEITLKYKDEDGDLVTIFDTSDLSFAIQCSRILRLTILLSGSSKSKPRRPDMTTYAIKKELQEIRNRLTSLIDGLEVPLPTTVPVADADASGNTAGGTAAAATPSNMQLNVNSREFDPLQQQVAQQPTHLGPGATQAPPAAGTPAPASSTSAPSEVPTKCDESSAYQEVLSSFGLTEGTDASGTSTTAAAGNVDGASSASGKSTPAAYPQQPTQPQQQQQQAPQQPQQQPHPGYQGYPPTAGVPVPQRGPYMAYPGQPYGTSPGDGSAGGAPRGSMPPTSIPAGSTSVSMGAGPVQAGQQPQHYPAYGYPQYPGFGVSGSPGAGFPQAYPGQPYPGNFSQAGPRGGAPSQVAVSQSSQVPAGPQSAVNRYPGQPASNFQPWPQ
ncbi:protein TFG-like isoform X2 [Macrobrachium nipponense]|uniref:protein TFG-like isoform X2 n=1 Tax=Macrobrachium nipponense TaxID=159736 RepID=UPI0030C8580C